MPLHRLLAVGLLLALGCSAPDRVPAGTEGGQWRSWAGDDAGTRYAPSTQIDASNFAELEVAWTWESTAAAWKREVVRLNRAGANPHPISHAVAIDEFQMTPLMVDGVLYGATGHGEVFALDAGTGEVRWLYDSKPYASAQGEYEFLFPKHRGVSYWRSGDDARIFLPTFDAWLLALDAETGRPVPGFGVDGRVDLTAGLRGPPVRRLKDVWHASPAAIHGDTVIVGSSMSDRPYRRRGNPGDIRAYDARTGALRWTFHVIPGQGEAGTESWKDGAWKIGGAANAWASMAVDSELGTVYAATSTPSNDLYGGHRPGDNLFAETLLCLDAETGERIWHRQLVRHGLWDYDLAAQPMLLDIAVDGRAIPAVVMVTKQGLAFVFDRRTGEPVWPIEDRPVPASDVPGERAAATQPFPTRPPPFEIQGTREEDLIDFTPELRAEALEIFRRYRTGPLFTPPSLEGTLGLPGPAGGAGWRGAGADPTTGTLFVPSIQRASVFAVTQAEGGQPFRYLTENTRPVWVPGGEHWTEEGLPLFKPPWSKISAIDLQRGDIIWQTALGDGPRDHPRLRHLDLPPLGSGGLGCVIVTATLLIATEGAEHFIPNVGEPFLHAFDKVSGRRLGRVQLPARARACPMTYEHEGRQLLVVAVSDRDAPQLIALALPDRP